MKNEIGGYFELERFSGQEYYPGLHKLNLGRTALLWLAQKRNYRKIYLPVFLCESVTEVCQRNGIQTESYVLDADLNVLLPKRRLADSECLYLVNYYGQLTDEKILYYKNIYGNVIVDHTHAFFQRPLGGIDTLYSCRKFWGVSDGAYVLAEGLDTSDLLQDRSNDRMTHILGRFEENAGRYYQAMLENAAQYEEAGIRRMSYLTENLLHAVDYEDGRQKRNQNYRRLSELLPSANVFNRVIPDGPFAYPFYHKNGLELRRWLAGHKIFVPTYWKNILENCSTDSMEYDWAANVLPLPCDQRYGNEEMEYIAARIREWEASEK